MRPKLLLLLVFATIVSSCNAGAEPSTGSDRPTSTTTTVVLPEVPPLVGLTTELVADGLDEPVTVVPVPPLDTLLVAERIGRIVEIASDGTQNTVLDVVDRVGWDINEQGFLAIAAHPDFPDDPRIVAIYTNIDRDVVVSTFDWTGDTFDPNSETPILTVPQPHQYHQGGGIVFGPAGYLWMSFGDGGGNGDPYGNGQNPFTLNGTVVR
ncbi:MAG: PQQ-dependent sugar dehydrogenase, partial [Acidimicrobiia bacterium]|nr:PQQ-dependent sugar dehydrogenase [Acidimicrobiia bacterium]